jgi:orotate phosphoribosyltransferase
VETVMADSSNPAAEAPRARPAPSPEEALLALIPARAGHFRLESGHHGDRWMDLESLCFNVFAAQEMAVRLCTRLAGHEIDAVCGPLVEGAFVALMVAEELVLPFTYSAPSDPVPGDRLFPVKYRIPAVLKPKLKGRRVAIVNDVIGAGSAVRGTLDDLRSCGAKPAVIGALAVVGDAAFALAAESEVPLEALARLQSGIWAPNECPLCAQGVPLSDPGEAG